ncbi:Leu/Phe/Val dehydrogenase [Azospirillum doebereinerae]|uniref:Glu/Leu/Phe/Val dehydrogenase n=1 Tax=Azospirillum doebereinerae TaxID=92933 RepID=A0A3S0VHF4_9PROT|nr:Glu/Leu/Phe/Val dehydrogenase dimerization domain-containing protein [Azospirillum doebereinerae]RUQ69278.1 Glu/Leu/Phe/Val dehydrogenase [Azospirillum doebereinerae]
MSIFGAVDFMEHEQVVFVNEPSVGLKAIVAIHNTSRGPAFGGCRMHPYASEEEAVRDVLRLSRGMTYKAAITRLPYGGGKSVIIGDPARDKTPELLRAMGRAVATLQGRYIMADDVGTTVRDMEVIRTVTPYAAGLPDASGEPCPATAYGVFQGLLATAAHRFGRSDLEGMSVAVQGLGSVGFRLCRYLHAAGAALTVSDVREDRMAEAAARFGARTVAASEILFAEADVLSPNALGAVFDDATIPRLRCKAVCGAANNQLADEGHGLALHRRGILYAPDFVVSAGGLIDVAHEGPGYDPATVLADCERIRGIALDIFQRAERENQPTSRTALRMAEENFTVGAARRAA